MESKKIRLQQIRRRHALRHSACKLCGKSPCECNPSVLRKHRVPAIHPSLELPKRLRE